MSYTVFESTNMATTRFTERIYDAVATEDVENGTFGYIEELADGESVIYNFHKGVKAGAIAVVVDHPAWDYDTSRITNQRKDKFINKANVPFRVRTLKVGDEFAVSVDGFTSATQSKAKKDVFATIDTTGKLVATTNSAPADNKAGSIKINNVELRGAELATPANNYGYSRKMYACKVVGLA